MNFFFISKGYSLVKMLLNHIKVISKSTDPFSVERGGVLFHNRGFLLNKETYLLNLVAIGVPLHKNCKMQYMSKWNFLGYEI